jgi:hypothetical protein
MHWLINKYINLPLPWRDFHIFFEIILYLWKLGVDEPVKTPLISIKINLFRKSSDQRRFR